MKLATFVEQRSAFFCRKGLGEAHIQATGSTFEVSEALVGGFGLFAGEGYDIQGNDLLQAFEYLFRLSAKDSARPQLHFPPIDRRYPHRTCVLEFREELLSIWFVEHDG